MGRTYELAPTQAQHQKSFYHKALVREYEDGSRILFSYGTKIMRIDSKGNLERFWDSYSATTGKHIKAFSGLNKKGYLALEMGVRR